MDVSDEDERDSNAPGSEEGSISGGDDEYVDVQGKWSRKLFNESRGFDAHLASSFDAYFLQANRTSKTSSNTYSQLVGSLSPDDFQERLRAIRRESKDLDERISNLELSHHQYFPAFINELASGFNLLFFGYGSKRPLLNKLARQCAKKGHVVVGNGFFLNFTLKELLASAEQLIDAPDIPDSGMGPEGQCRRILAKYALKPNARHLFFIIHNIDGPALRTERAKSCLRTIASHPSIHLAASVDHLLASTLFSTTDCFSRDQGFSWLWHDCSTLRPYDFETVFADRTSYAGASFAYQQRARNQAGVVGMQSNSIINENAAKHVLASVTAKAKRLFALICARQRAAIDAAEIESGSTVRSSAEVAISYELLFAAARDDFIATNETAMRALLGEFRDHNLVLSATAPEGGEALWIPLSKDALLNLASGIE